MDEFTAKPIQKKGIFHLHAGRNQEVMGSDSREKETDIKESRRNLDGQDDNDEDDGEGEGGGSYSYYDDAWEYDGFKDGTETGTTNNSNNSKIREYEAQALHLYDTAPAEWNSGQWIAFTLLGTLLMTCCVMLSFYAQGCCADDDDDYSSCRRKRRHKSKSRLLPSDSFDSDSDASSSRRWFLLRRSRRR